MSYEKCSKNKAYSRLAKSIQNEQISALEDDIENSALNDREHIE